ncbi:MAG: 2-succinylbenzoate--CoA ligase, partial [Crocosphaera sp.]
MSNILTIIKARLKDKWIIGCDSEDFYKLTINYLNQFIDIKQNTRNPKIILVKDNNNLEFLSAFLASIITNSHVFLCDQRWQEKEWQQVLNLVQPNLIIGIDYFNKIDANETRPLTAGFQNKLSLPDQNLIMIPTGGTSGKIRFAIHTWDTLSASVEGFANFFQVEKVNSFCVLPLYHVSGLMQFTRSFLTKGKIIIYPYSDLKKGIMPSIKIQDFFISLVPTQLQLLLTLTPHFLSQFKTILLGGAPPWNSLLETARKHHLNLSPTYGMTETASQVVTLKPQDFLQGNNSTGQVLPHAKITINKEQNLLQIKAKSLFFGYYPNYQQQQQIITDDLGYVDNEEYLYILGRNSQKIITGGENVFPKEIEDIILETNLVQDVCVIGVADSQWGEVVTAIYVPEDVHIDVNIIRAMIKQQLSPVKQPKYWI